MIFMSAMQRAMMPGRWTLMTTERAVAELRGVDLRDRRRRERLGLDVDEVRGLLGAELLVERALDVLERERLHAVEDLLELLDVRVGEHARRSTR